MENGHTLSYRSNAIPGVTYILEETGLLGSPEPGRVVGLSDSLRPIWQLGNLRFDTGPVLSPFVVRMGPSRQALGNVIRV